MTDRVTATQAVIEAAKEWAIASNLRPASQNLFDAIQALAASESPDLDALIAEATPSHAQDAYEEGKVRRDREELRDLIVSLLTEERLARLSAGEQVAEMRYRQGFEQAREQAAKIIERPHLHHEIILASELAQAIRSLTPDTERTG